MAGICYLLKHKFQNISKGYQNVIFKESAMIHTLTTYVFVDCEWFIASSLNKVSV